MIYRVTVAPIVAEHIAERYQHERPGGGSPCEADFWSGPLAAATLVFRAFEELPYPDVPAIRVYISVDPVFGAVAFTGVQVGADAVEIVGFDADPDYWDLIGADPDE